jgi:hypothetical protein
LSWRARILEQPVKFARFLAIGAATVLLGGFVGAIAERNGWFDFGKRPSVPIQLDAIRRQVALQGYGLVASKRADLHGTGRTSFILVFRSLRVLSQRFVSQPDEIRIYDVDNSGTLKLKFRFRPRMGGKDPPWIFRLDAVQDFDENGRPEIVGAWEQLFMSPTWPRPVVIGWNDAHSRYEIDPILDASSRGAFQSNRPILRPARPRGGFASFARRVYVKPTEIRNVYDKTTLEAYAVEDFAIERVGFGAIMGAIFITRGGAHADAVPDEVLEWNVGFELAKPQVLQCLDPRHPTIVHARYPLSEWLRGYIRQHRDAVRFCQ